MYVAHRLNWNPFYVKIAVVDMNSAFKQHAEHEKKGTELMT